MPKSKGSSTPYFASNKVTTASLELIHSDVWGPAPSQLVDSLTTLASLMIILSIRGYTCFTKNQMSPLFFVISKL
jgi:hypothetical protein